MQIKISSINSVSKTIRSTLKKIPTEQLSQINFTKEVQFFSNRETYSPYMALSLLTNWFSKEELKEVSNLENLYKSMPKNILLILKDRIFNEYIEEFNELISAFEDKEKIDTTLIEKNSQKSLKQKFLKLFAINNSIPTDTIKSKKVPLSYWFDTDFGMQKSFNKPCFYTHPEEKSIVAFGGYLKEDLKNIEKYQNKFKKYNTQELFEKKINILENLIKAQKGNDIYFEGSFSNRELREMKKLSCKYRALNNIQKSRGIFSKNIESLLFAPKVPSNIKRGDYIGGLGFVANQIKIDNVDFTVIFSEVNKNYIFNLYKTDEIDKKDKFLENLGNKITIEEINKLDDIARSIIMNKSELISQVRFQVLEGCEKKRFKVNEKLNDSELNSIKSSKAPFFYVGSFVNHYPKIYDKAGRIIGIQLLKFLKEKSCTPLFLNAEAYNGSTHSPVSMYLRAGFEPISHTKEELREKMSKNMSRFPSNEKVEFYLGNFDKNGELIDTLAKIYGLE